MTDRIAIPVLPYRGVLALVAAASARTLSVGTAHAQSFKPLRDMVGSVYTADETGNSISMINLATGQVTTVPTTVSPHNVQATADGDRLLAVGDTLAAAGEHAHGKEQGHDKVASTDKSAGSLLVFSTVSLGASLKHRSWSAITRRMSRAGSQTSAIPCDTNALQQFAIEQKHDCCEQFLGSTSASKECGELNWRAPLTSGLLRNA